MSSSVVVVHSSLPRRDYELLFAVLPRRFRSEDSIDSNINTGSINEQSMTANTNTNRNATTVGRRAFSLVASSLAPLSSLSSTTNNHSSNNNCSDTILVLPNMTIIPNNGNGNSNVNGKANGGGSIEDDLEFETVSLTTNTNTNTNTNRKTSPVVAPVTSFACLVLNNRDELRLVAELVSDQEGLIVEETKIQLNNGASTTTTTSSSTSSSTSTSLPLAKFVLPGGCLVTLSTSLPWTNQKTRSQIVEFMTTTITMTQSASISISASASNPKSRSYYMKRSMSMPDIIPPMVTTRTNSSNNNNNARRKNIIIIPTLQSKVLSFDGKYEPFPLNPETPIPIETELFSGQLLLICRPTEDPAKADPYWNERIFSKKKRRVVLQLQGKLKYKPTGTIFAGMEISDPMKLGLIANGLCNLILKMAKSFNPALHYSFGSKDERAHICFPASTFFDRFVVTPPGETPPEMGGIDFDCNESPNEAAARKAYQTKIDWNTDDTYSMSFHSMYVDFPSWSVVSLPIGRDISLQTFWGNSLAGVVLYEVDDNKDRGGDNKNNNNNNNTNDKPHLIASNKYLLNVQLKALGKDGIAAAAARSNSALLEQQERASEHDDDGDEMSEWGSEIGGGESISTAGDVALMPAFDEDDDDDIDTTMFFDTVESLPGAGDTMSMELSSTSSHNTLLSVIDTFCPCWIEMFSKRGKYVTLYAFCGTKRPVRPFFRTMEMTEGVFKDREEIAKVDDRFSHRVSSAERTRRILGLKYAEAHVTEKEIGKHHNQINNLQRFHKIRCRFDAKFLNRREPSIKKFTGVKSGFVARALSDRHWKEERMVLVENTGELLFHHAEGSKIHFRISLSSVIDVSIPTTNSDLLPLPSYYYLQVETFVHVTFLMFRSEEERDSWVDTVGKILQDRRSTTRSFTKELFQSEDPVHEFLTKSTMWNCQKRKILNCRRYSFRTPRTMTPEETLKLAERALDKVLSLKPKGANDSDLREFLDYAAALKEADAHSLNEEEKCAFFVNVYHIMIMHSYIILGPPVSGPEWVSYFNNIAYQCSDDIFSLAELEHNIIRAKMSYPSNFLSRFVLPKSQYHFALVRPDFRLNFALNPGSLSMPTSAVPVYKAATLNQQLNNVTEQFVGYAVHVKQKGKNDVQITLPRLCQWFAEDFGPNASASDVMFAIEPYLSDKERDALRLIWNSKKRTYDIGIFSLKYLSFNYECRFLTASTE